MHGLVRQTQYKAVYYARPCRVFGLHWIGTDVNEGEKKKKKRKPLEDRGI